MPGRKAVLAVIAAGVAAFGGGVALAATHSSGHTLRQPKLLPVKQPAVTNFHLAHHYCHKDGPAAANL